MSIQLEIPTHIAQALRLPVEHQEKQLLRELAVILYARGILPFGKARQLANMEHYQFGLLLGEWNIPRQYSEIDLQDDLDYACS